MGCGTRHEFEMQHRLRDVHQVEQYVAIFDDRSVVRLDFKCQTRLFRLRGGGFAYGRNLLARKRGVQRQAFCADRNFEHLFRQRVEIFRDGHVIRIDLCELLLRHRRKHGLDGLRFVRFAAYDSKIERYGLLGIVELLFDFTGFGKSQFRQHDIHTAYDITLVTEYGGLLRNEF